MAQAVEHRGILRDDREARTGAGRAAGHIHPVGAQARLAAPVLTLTLPATSDTNPVPETKPAPAIIDLPVEVEELLTPAASVPEKPARRIVVPDENRDFPL